MKALKYFTYLLLLSLIISCSDDLDILQSDDNLTIVQNEIFSQSDLYTPQSFDDYKGILGSNASQYTSIPTSVFASIVDHFPDVHIDDIKSFQSVGGESYSHYSVFLNNKTEAVVFQWGHVLTTASIEVNVGKNEIIAGELPFNALLLLYSSFDNFKIEEIINKGDGTYEVDFKNGDRISVDNQGKALSKSKDSNGDDDDDGTHINPSSLPQSILDYVSTNYPDNAIIDAEQYANKYEVELNNGLKLEFDLNGNFLEISSQGSDNDDSGEGDSEDIDITSLNQAILDYISANYPDATIVKAETNAGGYEVTLSNGIKLEFDQNGNFVEISGHSDDDNDDDDNDDSQNIDPSTLPQSVLDYIANNYPNEQILKAEMDGQGYEVILSNGIKLEFNANGEFREVSGGSNDDDDEDDDDGDSEDGNEIDISALPDTILRFVLRVCPNETIVKAEINTISEEYYEVTLSNGLQIEFDQNGIFLDISGSDCDEVSTGSVPQNILDYLSTEFNSGIDKVKACDYGYRIDLNDDTRIFFKADGTVIAIVLDA